MIRLIRIHPAAFWPSSLARFERPHITMCAGSAETCDWLTSFCHQAVNFEAIHIAFLTRDLSTIFLLLVELRPWNPRVVPYRDGKTVDAIDRCCIEMLPPLSSQFKQSHEELFESMPSTVQAPATEQMWDILRSAQEYPGRCAVAPKA